MTLVSRAVLAMKAVFFTAVCGILIACGGPSVKLNPVTGQLFFDDKPADGATLVFHQKNGPPEALKPAGVVDAQGHFKLNTYPHGEGAPEGEYIVLITWFEPTKNENANAKSRISELWSRQETSTLKVTIKPGVNTLEPFKLPKKPK